MARLMDGEMMFESYPLAGIVRRRQYEYEGVEMKAANFAWQYLACLPTLDLNEKKTSWST